MLVILFLMMALSTAVGNAYAAAPPDADIQLPTWEQEETADPILVLVL